MLNIRRATDLDSVKWDEYVLRHEEGGPYHLFAWQRAVLCAYGHESYSMLVEDEEGSICGVFPIVLVKPPLLKGTLVSQPFCDYGGILADDHDIAQNLADYIIDLAHRMGMNLEIRCKQRQPAFEKHTVSLMTNKIRMTLELPSSPEELWSSFRSKLRSQIRRPMKDGITFHLGGVEMLESYYEVFSTNMHALGSPVHSLNWMKCVLRSFAESVKIGIVKYGDLTLGSGLIICCRDTMSLPWASTLREYNHMSPNMLLYWGFLDHACSEGYRFFDFGRSTIDEGTYFFKKQWGAQPVALYWYFDERSYGGHTIRDSSGRIRQVAEKLWSRMPLALANHIGPVIRRYVTL